MQSETELKSNPQQLLLRTYIDLSILYCVIFPVIFLYHGALWAGLTQFFCVLGLLGARLALHYGYIHVSKLLSLASSYTAVTTQMFIYLPKEAGFHYMYLAIIIVAIELFEVKTPKQILNLILFTACIVASFFICEFYSLEVYKFLFASHTVKGMYIASMLGTLIGPVFIILASKGACKN